MGVTGRHGLPAFSRRQFLGLAAGALVATSAESASSGSASASSASASASAGSASARSANAARRQRTKGFARSRGTPELKAKQPVQTGQLLAFRSLPGLRLAAPQVTVDKPGQTKGLVLTDSHNGPGDQGPLILDSSGQPVWFLPVSSDATYSKRAMNLRAGNYLGKPVLSWWEGAVVNEHGEGHYLIAGQDYSVIKTVQAGNGYQADLHEFFITPQGTAYLTAVGRAEADLTSYGGSRKGAYYYGVAQEIDLATGKVLFQWRSDQHVGFDESYTTPKQFGTEPWDYFHLNCISVDGDGDLLLSARNTWAAYKVSRSTGAVLWRLGGKRSNFSFGPNAQFAWQHDVLAQPGGLISVFDNGAGVFVTEKQSRGLVLRPDLSTHHVDLALQFLHPGGPILARALGNVQLLTGGHTFIGWGNWAAFSEFSETGEPLLVGRLAGSTTLAYRAFRSSWEASPSAPPALAVERAGAGATVYCSWNGATAVTHWLVYGGPSRSDLSPIGTAAKAGFETEIALPSRPKYVAVAALDAGGHQLGRSLTLET